MVWSQRARDMAQREEYPFGIAFAHVFTAWLYVCRREPKAALRAVTTTLDLCDKHALAQMQAMAQILNGWSIAELGKPDDGIHAMREGIDAWRATGAEVARPHWLGLLAEQCLCAGRYGEAATCLAEGLTIIERTDERRGEAELLRLQGKLLLLTQFADAVQAEALFQRAIDVAQGQQALAWELRTALSLGKLWREQGKVQAAQDRVTNVYQQFSQGLDTPDLQDARDFLRCRC
jgi:predicted ATPase